MPFDELHRTAFGELNRPRRFEGRRRNDPAEVLMHQPPHEKALVCPAEKPYLAFKASWPRFHSSRSRSLGLLAERTWHCPRPAPPAQTPSQSHFRRRRGALRVFPFVIINRGLNLKYVERPKLGHFAIFPRGREYPCADHSDLSGQVVSRKNANLCLEGCLFVKLFLAPGRCPIPGAHPCFRTLGLRPDPALPCKNTAILQFWSGPAWHANCHLR
jgi:hypothetical protein